MLFRDSIALVMAYLLIWFAVEPVAFAQYGTPSQQSDPAQYAQQSPGAGQYPAPTQYAAAGQYSGGPYPGSASPGSSYPNPGYAGPNGQGQYPQSPNDSAIQESGAQDPVNDRQHGVARLSVGQGDVNVKRGDNGELVAAAINAPLMTQDHLQTAPGSRAEVELDAANVIRLAPNTDLGFADIEYHQYQVQLGAGAIIYRVLRAGNAQAEVDTPSIAFHPLAPGEYRIAVLDDGETQISVRAGEGEIYGPRGSQRLDAGRSVVVRGNPSDPEFQQAYDTPRDQFDDWSENRDRELLGSQSYRYVSADIYGTDDLDHYGNWVPSQYGQVWAPQAQEGDWAPYSSGQWAWENYYGWTWVDSAPWGWAPYHYGRWFRNGGYGWCWWPGSVSASYFWSPALVGFFGWGAVGVGFAGLGWVALAPFELFHSWWGHGGFGIGLGFGRGYDYGRYGAFRNVNVAGMYRNAGFRGAALTAGFERFGGPHQRFAAATRGQLSNASLFRGQLPISPTRGSYQFSNRQATYNQRLAGAENRRFFSHQQPGYGTARGLDGAAGSSVGRGFATVVNGSATQRFGNQHGVAPNLQGSFTGRNAAGSAGTGVNGGWQRFGDPGRSSATRQGFASGGQEQSGWHNFGEPHSSTPAYNAGPSSNVGRSYSQRGRSSFGAPNNGGAGFGSEFRNERPSYGAAQPPHYNAPQQHLSAPQQHFSAPAAPRSSPPSAPHHSGEGPSRGEGGGGNRGGGSHGGGGGHVSSGGHHGR